MNNFVIIILDGVGVGELPDANLYSDQGSNTLGNMADYVGGMNLPNLQKMGLGNIIPIRGIVPIEKPTASYGKLTEISKGKDSTTGHWEIGGLEISKEFPLFPNGFPDNVINDFISQSHLKGILGNYPASGTEIIKSLGEEHIKTGFPIVYTSGDSVFQIAAHEKYFGLDRLYEICKIARYEILTGEYEVGRVIARPFIGEPGSFTRTTNRKDYSVSPFSDTILDYLQKNEINTIAIGKINDLFNYKGITKQVVSKSNNEGVNGVIESLKKYDNSLIFVNLVDFDVYYGHRNDPEGFYKALIEFDNRLPEILNSLDESDRLLLTADHGNDPTSKSTDHSREYTPLLFFAKNKTGIELGTRKTFSDIAQTVAEFFKVNNSLKGESFLL
ncbi:MAG: phosphopentomutase [Melioribacteraceae bacterium]|nr:phosphopentomutase [Melioribacteraceae bacterium]